jgi:Asp-tRNA(Asn)/Glu-tRNA(Gln) amidotransferase A subunit family amidase
VLNPRYLFLFLCALLVPGKVSGAESLSIGDLSGAGRVAGVEFTEAEYRQMSSRLDAHLRALTEMRKRSLANSVAPALLFDPRPAGFVLPAGPEFVWAASAIEAPKNGDDLSFYTVGQLASLLRARKVTSEELTRLSLERLKKHGPALFCVVALLEERALSAARRADEEIKAGKWRGPLHGVPYGVKDLLDVEGAASGWGVSLYSNAVAGKDSTVVRKLEEAGAVLVAKFSLGELAMGDRWSGGLTRNPWKPEKGSSGSSAGSASAVAAGLVPFAIGSETLGSIVSPSTVCGITGLRPTFGRVSRAGAMTLCYSLDKIGPLARSVEDCLVVLNAIRGTDQLDRTVVDAPLNWPREIRNLRIGFLEGDFERSYPNRMNDLTALEVLRGLGVTMKPVKLPDFPRGVLNALLNAEAAAYFDELTRSNEDDKLVQQGDGSWPNAFRAARFVTAVDYIQANRIRAELMAAMDEIFREFDVLVAPSWQGNQLLYSNMTGHPCVVVPNGQPGGDNPASICFLAGLYREGNAAALAQAYQEATGWHKLQPKF